MDKDIIISLDEVAKGFGFGDERVEPIKKISIDVRRGETLVIIGQSGTGKSVCLRLMIGLLEPDSGRVLFEGEDLASFDDMKLTAMRKRMSMLFQGGALFDSMSVGENVAFGLRALGRTDEKEIEAIVLEKLRQVGLAGTEDKMPSELSGGMKKRAALARSIAEDPEVILYDEPTTGLDPIMSDAIGDLINESRAALRAKNVDVTSIVVTHDMHVAAKTADRIIMLHNGHIVKEDIPEKFKELQSQESPDGCDASDLLVRQFVRGEANGPIKTVVL